MFQHDGKLEHLLRGEDYASAEMLQLEDQHLFRRQWQFVGLTKQLKRPGDYIARSVLGEPVVVRVGEDGKLHAFRNICAHRHSLIAAPGAGCSKTFRCMYHGWVYGDDGRLAHLPDGSSFKGIDARNISLTSYPVATLGPMVFVNLNPGATSLQDSFGEIGSELESVFGKARHIITETTEHDVNWKVIAENAVESYHVPSVHGKTFGNYRDSALHEHQLAPQFTRYLDLKPWGSGIVGMAFKLLSALIVKAPTYRRFTQSHLFPNYLLYYGDLFASFIVLEPCGPTRTRHIQMCFVPAHLKIPGISRGLLWLFSQLFVRVGRRVMREDMALWPHIQAGLQKSDQEGHLSCREERVYAFQRYVHERAYSRAAPNSRQEDGPTRTEGQNDGTAKLVALQPGLHEDKP